MASLEYQIQISAPDGPWVRYAMLNPDEVDQTYLIERMASLRRTFPRYRFRVAERTTSDWVGLEY